MTMPPMRGQEVFWQWAGNQGLVVQTAERLQLDILVRTSRQAQVQLSIGIYSLAGVMMVEEYYLDREGQSLAIALDWGEHRARRISVVGLPLH